MDGREEKFRREMIAMGKALADLRSLIRRKRRNKVSTAKLTYEELDNLLDKMVAEQFRAQL
tara:strand:- start:2252 stop:2434 length:183 start_codon:yes stop_codon:yes gene_type:complete